MDRALQRLQELLKSGEYDLAEASLLIASAHYSSLDISLYLNGLEQMALEAARRLAYIVSPEKLIEGLNKLLFEELGYHGYITDYFDPANCFLNEAMDRRTGLPITLSVLYLTIAQRLRLPIVGVSMPLHFIVKYVDRDREIFIDPFHSGEILTSSECYKRIALSAGTELLPDNPAYLKAAPSRTILYRMLNNLKLIYLHKEEFQRAERVMEQMLIVYPESLDDRRDIGLLAYRQKSYGRSISWLKSYLELAPEGEDSDTVRRALIRAIEQRARLN